jgi:peptide/nickel transport system substrate-binding protein
MDAASAQLTAAEVQRIVDASLMATEAAAMQAQKAAEEAAKAAGGAATAAEGAAMAAKEAVESRAKKVLRISTSQDIRTFTPYPSESGTMLRAFGLIYSNLVSVDPINVNFAPDLAEHWEYAPDGSSITFFLREGALWHDGTPVTAKDVAFSIELNLDPAIGRGQLTSIKGGEAYRAGETDSIPGVVIIDDHTIRFDFEKPTGTFLNQLVDLRSTFPILPEHILGKVTPRSGVGTDEFFLKPIGSGAFKLVDEVIAGQGFTLEAFDDYFFGRPKIDEIVFRVITSGDAAYIALLRGDIDYATRTGFGSDYLAKFDAALLDPRITASGAQRMSGAGVFLVNVRKEHFKDNRVLQAMQYAMDRQALSDAFYGGRGVLVNSPLHVGAVAERADLKPLRYPYDPEKATQLLKDAGWDSDYVVPMIVYTRQMSRRPEMFAAIAQYLEAVGMKTEYEVLDDPWARFRSWNTDTPGAGEVMMSAINMGPDPDQHLMLFMHSTSWNGSGYANPVLDAKIEAARGVMTDKERLSLYQDIAFELQENYPSAFLSGSPGSIFLYNARWYTPFFAAQPRPTSTADVTYWPTKTDRGDWWKFHVEQWDIIE